MTAPLNAWITALADLSRQFERLAAENAGLRRRIKTLEAENNRLRWTRTDIPRWADLPEEMRLILERQKGGFFRDPDERAAAYDELRQAFEWAAERMKVPA